MRRGVLMKLIAIGIAVAVAVAGSFYAGMQVGAGPREAGGSAIASTSDGGPTTLLVAPLVVEDPQGDARDWAVGQLAYGSSCRIMCTDLPEALQATGTDGPTFDILQVALDHEAADSFQIALTLGLLQPGFTELDEPGLAHRVAEYQVCWEPAEGLPTRCVVLLASPHHDAATITSTFHIFGEELCSLWTECAWEVPAEITYGEPGTVRFTVPKSYASFNDAPLGVQALRATSGYFSANKALPLWHVAWTARVAGEDEHDHTGIVEPANVADRTEPSAESVRLAPASAPFWVDPTRPVQSAGEGSVLGAGGTKDEDMLDLVALDLHEEGDELVATYVVRGVDDWPDWDLQIATLIDVSGGEEYEFGVYKADENPYGYAGRCISFGCHEGYLVELAVELVPGSPGMFVVRVPLAEIGAPAPGSMVTFLLTYTMYGEFDQDIGDPGQQGGGNLHTGSIIDMYTGGVPYVFGSGHQADLGLEMEHDGH